MLRGTALAICLTALVVSAGPVFALNPPITVPITVGPEVFTSGLTAPNLPDGMGKPIPAACDASLSCDYPPPSGIYCSRPDPGTCDSGYDSTSPYGYVDCGSGRISCSPPSDPGCMGSCFSSIQCYSICSAGGTEPSAYHCNISHHCCVCEY
jgi:hypothetical protein